MNDRHHLTEVRKLYKARVEELRVLDMYNQEDRLALKIEVEHLANKIRELSAKKHKNDGRFPLE